MFYFVSRIISLIGAFLYPAYASYKTLARGTSEEDIERWLMYWSVLGVIISAEYVAEWLVRWIPFYWVIKTIFLLYLALPQTQGATLIYRTRLAPFLSLHEAEIDSALASCKAQFYAFLQSKLRTLWEHLSSVMLNQVPSSSTEQQQQQQQRASSSAGAPLAGQNGAGQQPTLANPVSGPVYMAWGLWNRYGPSIMAQGTAFLASVAAAPPATTSGGTVPPSTHNARDIISGAVASSTSVDTSRPISLIERRRQLEAELAQLPPLPHPASFDSTAPSMGIRAGWFTGWGASKAGYEKLKDE
ncbi:hypothetical protein BS47DRAFT_1375973 [Hydnum rufescens UP504]|uniref:Protein YOP1 n=1 Tax=Hydnum rufescens UP504 TaxID=1448309 RepID=A0A9P6B348_9AGAM|nr:hypothetical protein BS47DRAFT_1375973 [Hydnum rufescens UP504]